MNFDEISKRWYSNIKSWLLSIWRKLDIFIHSILDLFIQIISVLYQFLEGIKEKIINNTIIFILFILFIIDIFLNKLIFIKNIIYIIVNDIIIPIEINGWQIVLIMIFFYLYKIFKNYNENR